MRLVLLALIAACATTAHSDPTGPLKPGAETLDDTVTVALGHSADTKDGAVRVSFIEKLADSRCGVGMVCVWAGDVEAVIKVETIEVTGQGHVHTALQPKSMDVGDYQISLVHMTPIPGETSKQPPTALVRVKRPPLR